MNSEAPCIEVGMRGVRESIDQIWDNMPYGTRIGESLPECTTAWSQIDQVFGRTTHRVKQRKKLTNDDPFAENSEFRG